MYLQAFIWFSQARSRNRMDGREAGLSLF